MYGKTTTAIVIVTANTLRRSKVAMARARTAETAKSAAVPNIMRKSVSVSTGRTGLPFESRT
ncbi:MAG: hypothetical protein A2Y23_04965 [Clostridiales bacterium GWB2_37_7]|nr:MAG: hypothetical protein A2Y23_04965 [Clostridiales bacterium GWB2_37_7]